MGPFLIICIVLLIVNVMFLAMSIVHAIYGKSKPEDMAPRASVASSMFNRQNNPRLSLQPQVTIFELIRGSTGSAAHEAQVDGKRFSGLGPRESVRASEISCRT